MAYPLRRLRIKYGLTLAQLAAAADTNTGNLSKMEFGTIPCTPERAKLLTEYFQSLGEANADVRHFLFPADYPERTRKRRRSVQEVA